MDSKSKVQVMWRRRYFPLLSPNTPVSSTSLYWSAYGPPHWIWRGIRYWLFSFGYFLCSMGTADSTLPWTYTWFCQLHAGWVSASTHLSPISDLTDWLFRVVAFLCGRTHADSLVAESVKKSATGSNRELAWQALWMMQLCPLGMMWQPSIAIEKRFRHCSL